jgi:hypothetical protein
MSEMSPKDRPEWISYDVVPVAWLTDDGEWLSVRVRLGFVEMPHGGGRRFASQVEEPNPRMFVFSPASLARIIGAVRRGLYG